jgi:hypothetical protein
MTLWGSSVFGAMSHGATEDESLLSRMYIFRNSVGCPGCGTRVQKSHGCQHLTCGASSYGSSDWRGKGCGMNFCEVCESDLKESGCASSTCKRPDKAAALKVNTTVSLLLRLHIAHNISSSLVVSCARLR